MDVLKNEQLTKELRVQLAEKHLKSQKQGVAMMGIEMQMRNALEGFRTSAMKIIKVKRQIELQDETISKATQEVSELENQMKSAKEVEGALGNAVARAAALKSGDSGTGEIAEEHVAMIEQADEEVAKLSALFEAANPVDIQNELQGAKVNVKKAETEKEVLLQALNTEEKTMNADKADVMSQKDHSQQIAVAKRKLRSMLRTRASRDEMIQVLEETSKVAKRGAAAPIKDVVGVNTKLDKVGLADDKLPL